ncbi:MAG: isoprenoid biosynthesis glyoxalase ElbB [Phycisphaerales bacterium]|nr:isoprenoid biosynthesis glyoxalase ElbB [Phycisphaerales bacterium]
MTITSSNPAPTVAVILSGCGFLDGSEIHEATSCLIHLARHNINYRCLAPDITQADVVNHAQQKPASESRNVLAESARIARGQIAPLAELHAEKFDGIVFPGGFGAAKNLCTFAKDGPNCTVNPDVARIIKEFHAAGKPLAMCCIAPVLAAKVLGTASGGKGCNITLGNDANTAAAITKMGATHTNTTVTQAHTDPTNKLTTTAAYMYHANPYEVFQGVGAMIDRFAEMLRK